MVGKHECVDTRVVEPAIPNGAYEEQRRKREDDKELEAIVVSPLAKEIALEIHQYAATWRIVAGIQRVLNRHNISTTLRKL